MSKVMLVEDDDSLREIYSIRLTAEGYTIVSAKDGEEALAVAVRERPDLIVSDVMMPKISGFDMLDILRSTPETKDIKVIMMTALSSDDQRVRGERLGADRYLVKSQVGIEDVVNAVHDVLGDRAADGVISTSTPQNDPAVPAFNVAAFNIPAPATTPQPPMQNAGMSAPVAQTVVAQPQSAPMAAPMQASAPVQNTVPATSVAPAQPTVAQPVMPVQPIQPMQPAPQPAQTTQLAQNPVQADPSAYHIPPQQAPTQPTPAAPTSSQSFAIPGAPQAR